MQTVQNPYEFLIDIFYRDNQNHISQSATNSYNHFIRNNLTNLIKQYNDNSKIIKNLKKKNQQLVVQIFIGGPNVNRLYLTPPMTHWDDLDKQGEQLITNQKYLFPNEARLKNLSYSSRLKADIRIEYKLYSTKTNQLIEEKPVEFTNQWLCDLPVMLHSSLCVLNNKPKSFKKECGECKYDQGGYFIIDGQEKVLISQERIALNKLFIFEEPKNSIYSYKGLIRSTSIEDEFFPAAVELFCYKRNRKNAIIINIKLKLLSQQTSQDTSNPSVPLFIIFRALGIESDKDIFEIINTNNEKKIDDFLRFSADDSKYCKTQIAAFQFLRGLTSSKEVESVQNALVNNLFPNLQSSFRNKAVFLGQITRKFVKTIIGDYQPSDRDSQIFKRVDAGGFLYGNMIRDVFNFYRRFFKSKIDNYLTRAGEDTSFDKITNIVNVGTFTQTFRSDILQDNIRRSMKGRYGEIIIDKKINQKVKHGVVQELERKSYLLYIDTLRKVINPIEDSQLSKVEPHRLHSTQYGYFCPNDTPDGINIGIHRYLAVFSQISFDISSQGSLECCRDNQVTPLSDVSIEQINSRPKVFINSMLYGIYVGELDPHQFVYYLRLLRRNGLINVFISISYDYILNEINILSDSGRVLRPLIILRNNQSLFNKQLIKKLFDLKLQWQDIIFGSTQDYITDFNKEQKLTESYYISPFKIFKKEIKPTYNFIIKQLEEMSSLIEYIDPEETENLLIAMDVDQLKNTTKQYSHLEIDSSTMLSPVSQHNPFIQYNPAPRNLLFCQQAKQSIGISFTNFNDRLDTQSYVLHYPQKALVSSKYQRYYNTNTLGYGFNAIVAVMSYSGFNQEDAIIFNKGAVDRGIFNVTCFKTFSDEEIKDKNNGIAICFVANEGGIPIPEQALTHQDDIILQKVQKTIQQQNLKGDFLKEQKISVETSEINKKAENKYKNFIVDKIYLYKSDGGLHKIKIRLRQKRQVTLGSKFSQRCAQKGVCGAIIDESKMPFTKDGIIPDMIITPTAFPTRMTMAFFYEALFGNIAIQKAEIQDATAFRNYNYEQISQILTNLGMNSQGYQHMYDGSSGQIINAKILTAPIYYMRLKQMVEDKINYRSQGRYAQMTRQPVKGRQIQGGLKIGNMELDAQLAYGTQNFIYESHRERSDAFRLWLCQECGQVTQDKKMGCIYCGSETIINWDVSYSLKQFLSELNMMCANIQFMTQDFHEISPISTDKMYQQQDEDLY